uniref:G6F-LY6G6D fusion protein n=1 Tax=Mus musculus TaxID=10090 RepID=A0A1L6ZA37_MOUSE|nr:G6F-LY6G6D fusion protein [Mus musculus]
MRTSTWPALGLLQGPDPVPLLSCQDTARGAMTAVEAPATPASRQ